MQESNTHTAAQMQPSEEFAHTVEIVRDHIERSRDVPKHLVQTLTDQGFYKLLAPKALGGLEMAPVEAIKVISKVAELDASLGWIGMIYSVYSFFAGRLSEEVAAEIFSSPDAKVAGVMAPSGRAIPMEGGYRLTGRWAFASGSSHANWIIVGGLVWIDNGPEMQGPAPHIRMFFLPADQYTVHDTWHVPGLKGTGSHDISLTDIFVEDRYSYNFLEDKSTLTEPLYNVPVFSLFIAAVAAATLGIARKGVNAYKEAAINKKNYDATGQLVAQSDSVVAQLNLGKAMMLLDSADAYLHKSLEDLSTTAISGEKVSNDEKAKVRAACINAGLNGVEAVQLVQKTLGTAAMFLNHPLEKAFRDVNTASQHMAVQEKALETVGRVAFGMSPGGPI